MYYRECMVLGVRESVVVAGSCDVLLGYSEVSGYDTFISELLVNLELKRFVVYQVSTDLVGALRVWASRGIIKRMDLRKGGQLICRLFPESGMCIQVEYGSCL